MKTGQMALMRTDIPSQHTGLTQITERLHTKMVPWYQGIQTVIWVEIQFLLSVTELVLQLRWQIKQEIKQKQYMTLTQEKEL